MQTQSTQPRLKTNGPRNPTTRLTATRFILNHSANICRYPFKPPPCFSSGSTRVMPRASRPARPSTLAFHLASLPLRTCVGGISCRSEELRECFTVAPALSPPMVETLIEISCSSPRFSTSCSGMWWALGWLREFMTREGRERKYSTLLADEVVRTFSHSSQKDSLSTAENGRIGGEKEELKVVGAWARGGGPRGPDQVWELWEQQAWCSQRVYHEVTGVGCTDRRAPCIPPASRRVGGLV